MAFVVYDDALGFVDLYQVDAAGPGPLLPNYNTGTVTAGRMAFPGMELRGYDNNGLGAGTFIYAKATAAITVGQWVEFTAPLTSATTPLSATPWAGTIRTGRPLGICIAASVASGSYAWFQISGCAVASISGTIVAGDIVYWQATGTTSSTLVAGKQVIGAVAATAASVTIGTGTTVATGSGLPGKLVLTSAFAVVAINRPAVQTNIT